ncbi:unnamed protein product [Lactuca saligna]|uniref:Uncharacterized protein n=1 Tax=Lactuca saligna TaxID=75948 RepID=A0AA35ZEK0_LACSI|nr:unnamed protein product [Lactuca saligna]
MPKPDNRFDTAAHNLNKDSVLEESSSWDRIEKMEAELAEIWTESERRQTLADQRNAEVMALLIKVAQPATQPSPATATNPSSVTQLSPIIQSLPPPITTCRPIIHTLPPPNFLMPPPNHQRLGTRGWPQTPIIYTQPP